MTSFSDEYVSNSIVWNGIEIEIRYASHWCGRDYTSHLEIHVVKPAKTPLPHRDRIPVALPTVWHD